MLELIISIMSWYFLDKYTNIPWFWKFCIVLLILLVI